tara:strand:+ start:483 stop:731 length:249 start_codon:yes stop_codon:yes gene_type:complete
MRFKQGSHYERSQRIDLALAVLECLAKPDQPMTHKMIGEVCGCSHAAIQQIEISAKKKFVEGVRKAFGGKIPPEIDTRRAFQ